MDDGLTAHEEGERMKRTMKEWSEYFGIPYSDVCSAMGGIRAYGKRNQAFEEALVRKRLTMHYEHILARATEREWRCKEMLGRIGTRKACETCRYDMGGGYNNCKINLEAECAAGGYEAWEAKEATEP